MIAVLQRVRQAHVSVDGVTRGNIGPGLLALVCVERFDTETQANKMLAKILKLRLFGDRAGKMNHNVQNMDGLGQAGSVGGLLLVSQFTLVADTSAGNRPSFTAAALPEEGRRLFDYLVAQARQQHPLVQAGVFAADMQVSLVNDGPVTIPLRIAPAFAVT